MRIGGEVDWGETVVVGEGGVGEIVGVRTPLFLALSRSKRSARR